MAIDFGGFGLLALLVALVNVAVLVGAVVLIFLGIRWLLRNTGTGAEGRGPGDDAALAALRERFARGEIDAREFEERRRVLGG
jgi:putative membrane protein